MHFRAVYYLVLKEVSSNEVRGGSAPNLEWQIWCGKWVRRQQTMGNVGESIKQSHSPVDDAAHDALEFPHLSM